LKEFSTKAHKNTSTALLLIFGLKCHPDPVLTSGVAFVEVGDGDYSHAHYLYLELVIASAHCYFINVRMHMNL
jgi:hypothetical protein